MGLILNRRYATDGKWGLANRGLKPTATIMASLRDELRGWATNYRLVELPGRWGGQRERIGTKTANKPLLPLTTFSPSHFLTPSPPRHAHFLTSYSRDASPLECGTLLWHNPPSRKRD